MSAKLHYNSISDGICHSQMLEQRESHNKVKKQCINDALFFSGTCSSKLVRVLDVACGRGGDLPKLQHLTLDYHGIDVADKALDTAHNRFEEMNIAGSFHSYNGDPTRLDLSEIRDCDICLLNFALHYFTDSLERCDKLFKTMSDSLRKGGILCGICPDATRVRCSQFASCLRWPTFGELEANPWGHAYFYSMPPFVNAQEYLVPMDEVINVAYKHGLYLVKKRGIQEYAFSKGINGHFADNAMNVFMFLKV
ncbi:MAG: hypothetical protein CMM07_22585 [Rhodopirellula sp.]|nr:hypothetical protein [Rhodopirellula sp.]